MQTTFLRNAIILGLLSAIGPFAIDMYLPALPSIGADLQASPAAVQLSLLVFFLTMGFGQLVVGPLSDIYGRKLPLYGGLILFAAASVGAALAPSVEWLIAFRVLQGLGAAAAGVIPRAIVRDLHTGTEAARLMSMLMLVFSISPILAPLAGSFIIESFGWRAVFWAVLIAALVAVVLLIVGLKETRPQEERAASSIGGAVRAYGKLLQDRNFLGLVAIGGFGISSFFIYLANSPFVIIDYFGMTPRAYSLFFSVNAVAFFAMSQMTGYLTGRFGLRRVVRVAVSAFTAIMLALVGVTLLGFGSLPVMATLLFFGYGFLGLVIPTTSVLAMENYGHDAGTASALMGTLQFAIGAVAMAASSAVFDGTPVPMIVSIGVAAATTFVIAQVTLGAPRRVRDMEIAPAE